MDIQGLIVALVFIGIICIIASVIPFPEPARKFIWAIVSILCLLILLGAVTGSLPSWGKHG